MLAGDEEPRVGEQAAPAAWMRRFEPRPALFDLAGLAHHLGGDHRRELDPLEGPDAIEELRRPRAQGAGVNFGVTAAKALEERKIDGFWANGMGTEVAVRRGVGTVVLDVRRGDGPKPCFNYTMASIATTDRLIERSPETAAAVVRAIVRTHAALKENVARATEIGRKLFPPSEAELKSRKEALEDLNTLLAALPSHAEALHQRGRLYENLGLTRQAISDFEHACTLGLKAACQSSS